MSTRSRRPRAPIWTQPAPGSRKPRFSRDQIAEAAIRIADSEGFEAVSMRRIADELGAATMTLYYYVRTKEDLVTLMDDAIMGEVVIPDAQFPRDWRAALATVARSSYRAFRSHPWALDALRGARWGPNGMRHFEQSLAAVANAPFDEQGKFDALGIVDDYVFGHVMRAGEAMSRSDIVDGKPSPQLLRFMQAQLATGAFPHVSALLGKDSMMGAWSRISRYLGDAERFERGLETLIDGIARWPATRKR
jgi:AcrR family transcriptional regulator